MDQSSAFQALQQAIQQLGGQQPGAHTMQQQGNQAQSIQQMDLPSLIAQGKKAKYKMPTHSVIEPNPLKGMHPVESQAAAQAMSAGADPGWLSSMSQYLGKNQFLGLCEAFVEQATKGVQGLYSSAIDAWNKQQGIAKQGLSGIQPGDTVYFAPDQSNGGYGHTGVYMGGNKFVSATYNGIKQYDLNDWQKGTGQKLLGYIPENAKPQTMSITQPKTIQAPDQRQMQQMQPQQILGSSHPETGQLARQPMQQTGMSVPRAPMHAQNNPLQGLMGIFGGKS